MALSFILGKLTLYDIDTSIPIALSSTVSHKTHHPLIIYTAYLEILGICTGA